MNDVTAAERPAARFWRLTAVSVLSIVSGMPFALLAICLPAWLKLEHVDIKAIGLLTLAQVPWGFKFLWSPLMDRYAPPLLGRKRGWVFIAQVVIAIGIAVLGVNAVSFDIGVVSAIAFVIAFTGASFDIAYDAYVVEVLSKAEYGLAVGLRSGLYRAGMFFAGHLMITLGPWWGWRTSMFALSALFVAMLPVTWLSPEPNAPPPPVRSLKDAVWEPFVGMLSRPRALEILAFVTLYRLAASLSDALTSPFLIEHGYKTEQVGAVRGLVVMLTTVGGTVLGGVLAKAIGTSRALWIGGIAQCVAPLGFAYLAASEVNNLAMYAALSAEAGASGMAWGAFGVLLLRMTDKRFSATQYALFSSLVGLARTLVGPVAGLLVDALGWRDFFFVSVFSGVPGMILLQRFAPWGDDSRDLAADTAVALPRGAPWGRGPLATLGTLGGATFLLFGLLVTGALRAVKIWRESHSVDIVQAMLPTDPIDLLGSTLLGLCGGLAVAAYLAARGRRNVSSS